MSATAPLGPAALSDDLLASYTTWREASSGIRAAYERWCRWKPGDRSVGFGGYREALQQEEHAARLYGERLASSLRARVSAS